MFLLTSTPMFLSLLAGTSMFLSPWLLMFLVLCSLVPLRAAYEGTSWQFLQEHCVSPSLPLQEHSDARWASELDSAAMNLVVSRGMFLMEANSLIFFNLTRTLPWTWASWRQKCAFGIKMRFLSHDECHWQNIPFIMEHYLQTAIAWPRLSLKSLDSYLPTWLSCKPDLLGMFLSARNVPVWNVPTIPSLIENFIGTLPRLSIQTMSMIIQTMPMISSRNPRQRQCSSNVPQ